MLAVNPLQSLHVLVMTQIFCEAIREKARRDAWRNHRAWHVRMSSVFPWFLQVWLTCLLRKL